MANTRDEWYDPLSPANLHEDLARDFVATWTVLMRRASTRRHFEQCAECQGLKHRYEDQGATPVEPRRRLKYVLSQTDMRRLLGLPAGHEIVHMFVTHDPNVVQVVVTGEGLPVVPEGVETDVAGVSRPFPA